MRWNMDRINQFLQFLGDRKLEAFLLTNRTDVRCLSGFSGSAGVLWISEDRNAFITDFRYKTQAEQEVGEKAEIFITDSNKTYIDIIKDEKLAENKFYVGFDAHNTSYDLYRRLSVEFPDINLIPIRSPLEEIRARKDESEIENIRQAAKIAMEALAETLPLLRPGIVEKEFAAELEYRMRKKGSEKSPFDIIVASGWRAALPHGIASDKTIEVGEMITIDYGATYAGYASDITRTFFLGNPDEKFRRIYQTVFDAQQAAIDAAKAGMTGKKIDDIARKIISDAGFGENFGHGLGHGLGLVVHDFPAINQRNEKPVPENAVITIEPGIYIEGWGGVRIEDDIIVGKDGATVITDELPRELRDIVIPVS
ncbi:hypothetical protein DRQ26_01000 [bacterium]|nr:MAG: hypothetical protein DRQ26_01000 [bacterium]